MSAATRQGLGLPVRLLLLLVAVAAGAAPVFLYLADEQIQALLGWIFPPGLDLADGELLATWRALLAAAAGLLVCLLLLIVALAARRRGRLRRARLAAAAPLTELRAAIASGDSMAIEQAARRIAAEQGDEVVPELIAELDRGLDEATRQALAATLYKLGRAVTAEVELGPRR